jgi:aspartyl-tRNA(Asn)/glutamyl-tRNA(Gln) amidotransferase subunit A
MSSIPPWTSLDPAAQQRWRGTLRDFAKAANPHFNVFASIEPAADKPPYGVLAGMPYAAKDMFRIAGRMPTGGLPDGSGLTIAGESDLLRQLDEAGADRVGFTNMTELAYEPSGYNASRGRTKNPWNTDFIAGGSSSGSAVAVAIGAVAVAIGSDTAGSLRIPASACGVTALKPTNGLASTRGAMSTQGAMPLSPSLDTIGFLARDAADLTLVASASLYLPRPHAINGATVLADALEQSEPAVRAACSNAIDAIGKCGVTLMPGRGLQAFEAIDPHVLTILQAEAARAHRALLNDGRLSPSLRRRLAKGAEISDETLENATAMQLQSSRSLIERIFGKADIVLLPVMPIRTPEAALCDPESDRFAPKVLYELSRFTRFANFLGLPAVAMPAGFDDRGLPVALQIVGRPGQDLALLELALAVQTASDWHARMPTALAQIPLQPGPNFRGD